MGRMSTKASNDVEVLKQNIQRKFAEIRAALQVREKLLLRQLDVIAAQHDMQINLGRGHEKCKQNESEVVAAAEIKFFAEQKDILLNNIRSFGNFKFLDNMMLKHIQLLQHDVCNLPHEDYITPINDHEILYKCLQLIDNNNVDDNDVGEVDDQSVVGDDFDDDDDDNNKGEKTTIVVDFAHKNKILMENNRRQANESIINLTLKEAKELICSAIKIKQNEESYAVVSPINLEDFNNVDQDYLKYKSSNTTNTNSNHHKHNNNSEKNFMKKKIKNNDNEKNLFKSKITINNCNGTINLRNIANLTINCNSEETINAEIPLKQQQQKGEESIYNTTTTTTTNKDSNKTATESTRSSFSDILKEQPKKSDNKDESEEVQEEPEIELVNMADYDEETIATNCDFYNRLLSEIQRSINVNNTYSSSSSNSSSRNNHIFKKKYSSLKQQESNAYNNIHNNEINTGPDTGSSSAAKAAHCHTSSSERSKSKNNHKNHRRLVLKNFENLKIILEANSHEEGSHPVQIEQWLAEIISETDVEPIYNNDILEHSKIYSNNST